MPYYLLADMSVSEPQVIVRPKPEYKDLIKAFKEFKEQGASTKDSLLLFQNTTTNQN